MRRALHVLAWGWIAAAAATTPAVGDRLHLEGGGLIEVEGWWIEGDTIVYRRAEGTVALPRSLVVAVEGADGGRVPTPPNSRAATATSEDAPPSPDVARRAAAARRALAARDFEAAATQYGELLAEVGTALPEPRIGYALALLGLGEDVRALPVVLDGLARDPHDPALLEILGDLRNREERVSDAVRAWKHAFERAPNDRLRDKILKGERELHTGRDYATDMSAHFNVRYDGEVDHPLAAEVADYLEDQYWVMADLFDHAPAQPITVLLYAAEAFRDVTQAPEWVGGLYDGKIRVPLGGLRQLHLPAQALLRHELAHAFLHLKSRGRCPRWLHEGVAQVVEGRELGPAERHDIVRKLREIEATAWDANGLSYPMALSLTAHLVGRRGFHAVVELVDRLGQGASLEQALDAAFGGSYAELCQDWASDTLQGGSR